MEKEKVKRPGACLYAGLPWENTALATYDVLKVCRRLFGWRTHTCHGHSSHVLGASMG